jgi:hypothetical protein
VKQHKEEWDVVMDKVERIAGMVDQVGSMCEEYNLEEKDIPRGLRDIFESLVTYVTYYCCGDCRSSWFSELDEIKRSVKENNEVGGVKKLFLRKDLLRKVKQHDAKLSNVLQTFHVRCPFPIMSRTQLIVHRLGWI